MNLDLSITRKQKAFIDAESFEVLYGGAAGGGKSYGQLIDALLFALQYPGSKQVIFRRTFAELEKSIIRTSLEIYPRDICTYNDSKHVYKFVNGSVIDFAYCDNTKDVYRYQSAEFDIIRFDELTHFDEEMYVYLISRCRGANDFPKHIKSSTNPGGVGHAWVKKRFIDIGPPNEPVDVDGNTRVFIPALVQENKFLMQKDAGYVKRLEALNENDRKALLYGDWDLFEGQYFSEFNRNVHVIRPFNIPEYWRRYIAFDYGLDMFACLWFAVDEQENCFCYKEIYASGLIVTDAVQRIKGMLTEKPEMVIAPPDLWNRHSDTGKSTAELFAENGIPLAKCSNDRVQGWYELHEYLKIFTDEQKQPTAKLKFFSNCLNVIRCLPAVQFDSKNPNDVAREPHELTHSVDALRYFISGRPYKAVPPVLKDEDDIDIDDEIDNFINFGN